MRNIVGLAVLLVGALVTFRAINGVYNPDPEPALVTNDNYARIRIGMSEHEVQSILAGPTGTARGISGKGIHAAVWQNGKMTFLSDEEADSSELTEGNGRILEAVGTSPLETKIESTEWTVDNVVPRNSALFFQNKGAWAHMGYLGSGFSYSVTGSIVIGRGGRVPRHAGLEVSGRLKGKGALWEGLDSSRISIVFEDDEVIYKSYYRPASDPSAEGDPPDPEEQQPQNSTGERP